MSQKGDRSVKVSMDGASVEWERLSIVDGSSVLLLLLSSSPSEGVFHKDQAERREHRGGALT